ncbi:AAA family ATPase [Streptomyces sp. NPDC058255]|uniref:AAA family ATPase n=1 Tax=Streptomyces sp. NPDC058255 TaxID=3346407 RepID=UPI0036E6E0A9
MIPAAIRCPLPFITRVRVDNYKFMTHCDTALSRFTFLFGLNAAGKSNFLDALCFLRDALADSPGEALRAARWEEVLRAAGRVSPSIWKSRPTARHCATVRAG